MKKLKINEDWNPTDVVYIQQNSLWTSYSPGSGMTTQIAGDPYKFRGYLTDKQGDDHFDSNVANIAKWADKQEGIKVKDGTTLFKIPCYWGYKPQRDLSIWGGNVNPDYYLWMSFTKAPNYNLINFFKTKNEALGFHK